MVESDRSKISNGQSFENIDFFRTNIDQFARYMTISYDIGHFRAITSSGYFCIEIESVFFVTISSNVPCSQLWTVDKTYHVFTSSCLHPTTSRVNKYLLYRSRTWYGWFKGFDEFIGHKGPFKSHQKCL